MAEKKLNVRLNLKYDSFENWQKSTLVLNAGEAAVAYIESGNTQEVNSVATPQVLIKIGNGKDVFKDLPFVTAKAGDVYGWAKAAVKPEYQASEIKGLEDFIAGEIQDTNTKYKLEQDANNAHVIRLYSQDLGATEWTEVASITTADTVYDDTQVKADIKANSDAIDALELLVGSDSVATQIGNAIAALKLSETYAAKSHTHTKAEITDFAHNHEMGEINGLADALAGKEAAGEGARVEGLLNSYIGTNDARVKAVEDDLAGYKTTNDAVIAAIKDGAAIDSFGDVETELAKYQLSGNYSVEGHKHVMADITDLADAMALKADKSEVEGALELKADKSDLEALAGKVGTVAEGSTVVGMIEVVDGKTGTNAGKIATLEGKVATLEANGYDDTEVRGLISDNAEAIEALEGTHATDKAALEGAIALKADKTALEEEIERAKAAEKANTDEIARVNSVLVKALDNNDEGLDSIKELATWVDTHGKEAATMAEGISQNAEDIDVLEGRMDDAEAAIEALEADTHTHENKGVLDGITAEKVAAWDLAEANVQADWNQNDETADDYIKNRPFYTIGEAPLLFTTQGIEPTMNMGYVWSNVQAIPDYHSWMPFEAGKTYAVVVHTQNSGDISLEVLCSTNGKLEFEYESEHSNGGMMYTTMTITDNANGHSAYNVRSSNMPETISVYNGVTTIKHLDDKFISSNIARTADLLALEGRVDTTEGKIAVLEGKFTGTHEGSVSNMIAVAKQEAIDTAAEDATSKANQALVDAKAYADAEDAKIEERIVALEAADEAQDGLLAGLRTDVDLKATKAEHDALAEVVAAKAAQADLEGVAGRVGTLETEIVKKANDADLAAIAKTGSIADLVQPEDLILVLDCGNSGVTA